jgi:erythromycin esterase-like protein
MRAHRRWRLRSAPSWASALLVVGLAVCDFGKAAERSELDRLVRDVCDKQVVLLGEDANHGSGATVAAKVRLIEKLVDRCGFRQIAFESGFYDFVDFGRSAHHGKATQSQLADAIGGLWSTTAELEPLLPFLLERANRRAIEVVGIDLQPAGATYRYAQQRLPTELAAYLGDERKASCRDEIDRLTNWRYDDKTSFYDEATRQRIHACANDIENAARRRKQDPRAAADARMAQNLAASVELDGRDAPARRDKAMYENLAWHLAQHSGPMKTIVWCATVHASKAPAPARPDRKPMGEYLHDALGDRSAAIGFSALSGSYGRPEQAPRTLAPAPDDSLEARFLRRFPARLRYLDRNALDAAGKLPARPLDYAHFDSADWGRLIDGLVLMRDEEPLHATK